MISMQNNLEGLKSLVPDAATGQCLLFMAARDGVGTSTVAREYAQMMAPRLEKGVLLVDLDFFLNGQFEALSTYGYDEPKDEHLSVAPDDQTFWRLIGEEGSFLDNPQALMSCHKVRGQNLYVSCFHHEAIEKGQRVQVVHAPDYWAEMRKQVGLVIVDAPALERSRAGLALVRAFDGAVIVVDDEGKHDPMVATLRDDIRAREGDCKGVVVNRFETEPFRQAG